jgi:hypothetical protein
LNETGQFSGYGGKYFRVVAILKIYYLYLEGLWGENTSTLNEETIAEKLILNLWDKIYML